MLLAECGIMVFGSKLYSKDFIEKKEGDCWLPLFAFLEQLDSLKSRMTHLLLNVQNIFRLVLEHGSEEMPQIIQSNLLYEVHCNIKGKHIFI